MGQNIADLPPSRRPRLRRGARGDAVRYLQTLLADAMGLRPPLAGIVPINGRFGGSTEDAVSFFQYRVGLSIDGVVGPGTWGALDDIARPLLPLGSFRPGLLVGNGGAEPQVALPAIAASYVGATEEAGNQMGTDARMREIFEADDLAPGGDTDGYPWCAAFVSLCTQQMIALNPYHYSAVSAPREPSVARFLNSWARGQRCLVFKPSSEVIAPQVGDIVVYVFSHIGIVETPHEDTLDTIEGNTDDGGSREGIEVARRSRSKSQVRALIRLPVRRD